jgi:hypothetical protein
MPLLNWLRRYANGNTASQIEARAARANARSADYMAVVQWEVENTDFMPLELTGYADAAARCTFRPGHAALLLGYQSDILRKISHLGAGHELVMKGFMRADGTTFCIFVGGRDRTQNYTMLKPYWFLAAGETEAGFKVPPVNVINVVRH